MSDDLLSKKQLLAKHASGMIERSELCKKMDMTSNGLSSLISLMRKQGHEIWSINTDHAEWFVIYKDGPEIKENKSNVLRKSMKGWMTRKMLADASGIDSYEMAGLLCGLVLKGDVIKRKAGRFNEYRMASEVANEEV